MESDFFTIYEAIAGGISSEVPVTCTAVGDCWSLASAGGHTGIAMSTAGDTLPPIFETLNGLPVQEAANAAASWNFKEAGLGLAAANAYYNTPERIEALGCAELFDAYCTRGMDFAGKTVGVIGHMHPDKHMNTAPAKMYILERAPKDGDYPDSACDFILPQCDVVFISGSTIVNKTLPHLLELCKDAYTILIGPSVPLCPALLDLGIDRLSGMVVTDAEGMYHHAVENTHGSPYRYGTPFLLIR